MSQLLRRVRLAAVLSTVFAVPVSAQTAKAAKPTAPTVVGAWQGTASVPLKDSTLTVPVLYTFTQTGDAIGGSALVPGQGSGPISHVVIDGKTIRFRVTATTMPAKPVPGKPAPPAPKPNELEHDGTFTADGAIEGFVNLDKQPVAKFRIVPSKGAPKR